MKGVPQWIKKYHEKIVANGFSHLWSSFIKIFMPQVLIGNTGILPLIKTAVAIDGAVWQSGIYELKEETSLEQVVELAGGFQPDYLTDCIVLERLSPIGRELIPVLYEKNYLGTAVRNFDVIKIYPNSSILPKYFCLDTSQNKALSLNQ